MLGVTWDPDNSRTVLIEVTSIGLWVGLSGWERQHGSSSCWRWENHTGSGEREAPRDQGRLTLNKELWHQSHHSSVFWVVQIKHSIFLLFKRKKNTTIKIAFYAYRFLMIPVNHFIFLILVQWDWLPKVPSRTNPSSHSICYSHWPESLSHEQPSAWAKLMNSNIGLPPKWLEKGSCISVGGVKPKKCNTRPTSDLLALACKEPGREMDLEEYRRRIFREPHSYRPYPNTYIGLHLEPNQPQTFSYMKQTPTFPYTFFGSWVSDVTE